MVGNFTIKAIDCVSFIILRNYSHDISTANNDYTICIKRETQTYFYLIRSSRCFFNIYTPMADFFLAINILPRRLLKDFWSQALQFGNDFVFTVAHRYRLKDTSFADSNIFLLLGQGFLVFVAVYFLSPLKFVSVQIVQEI